ncbi:hypothetical protein B0O99DRAFT_613207 [Bisporella sp. PMI_857]|nr:hypothetical protein B0O99DRAFT_613207 [Bisporella sp. PMI_857]
MRFSLAAVTAALLSITLAHSPAANEPLFNQNFKRQLAAGGGAVDATIAPTQSPTISKVNYLTTIGGKVTVVPTQFTQTFAKTALGTWPLGATPSAGVIGLGNIQGTVG